MPTRDEMINAIREKRRQEKITAIREKRERIKGISPGSSLATGAASGITFGTAPLAAGVGAAAGTLSSHLLEQDTPIGESFSKAGEAFLEGRRERNQLEQESSEANPGWYGAGNIGGAIATAPLTGGQGLTGPLKQKMIQAGTQGAKVGGAFGAGTAAGSSGDVSDAIKRIVSGVALGGGMGAATTGALAGGQKGLQYIKQLLAKRAASKGVKGSGIIRPDTPKDIKTVLKEDVSKVQPSPKTVEQNVKYKEAGLEELSPTQMQAKAYGEPTPTQYAETVLKANDPKLYQQQLRQVESYEQALNKYKGLGAPTRETAGQQIKQGLLEGKKIAGKTIGQFKKEIAKVRIRKGEAPKVPKEMTGLTLKDPITGKSVPLSQRVEKLRNFKQLDALSSDISVAKNQKFVANGYQGDRGTRALGEYKAKIEKFMETFFPEGKPREAYRQYAQVKNIFNDTLKGTLKTGGSDKVLNKVTATAENFNQFKMVAEGFKKPKLIEQVKDNYLSGIFNSKNWKLSWEKAAKTEALNVIVPKDVISKVKLLLKYDQQMRSTMTSTVNPSRSGIVSSVVDIGKKPIKNAVMDIVFGEKRQMKKALDLYKNISKGPKQITQVPLRKTRSVVGREAHRELMDD